MKTFRPFLLILALGLALYLPSLPNHFVWDDEEQVVANVAVHSLSHLPTLFAGSTFNTGGTTGLGGLYYKPLMSASFALLYTIFGPHPWAFHLFQLLLHLGSTCLLYIVFRSLLPRPLLALPLALLFLIHPQNVETVVYISALQDTLYFFFGLLALTWLVLSHNKLRAYDYFFVGFCLLLSLLSKETGVLFLPLTTLYLLLYSRRPIWPWILTTSSVFGLYLFLRFGVAHVGLNKHFFTPIATLPLWSRLQNAPAIVTHYLSQFVYPDHLAISQHWVVSTRTWPMFYLPLLLCLLLCGISVYFLVRVRRLPHFTPTLFFFLWFLLGLGLHLHLFPLDMTVADRWFYFPLAGLLGFLGGLVPHPTWIKGRPATLIFALVLLALFIRSSLRVRDWRDGLTLYSHDIALMPNSFDLQNNLGVELFRVKKYALAKTHFQKSVDLAPTWWTNWNNLGAVIEREGDLETALSYYDLAIHNGAYYLAYPNYASVLLKLGRIDEARDFLHSSLTLFPQNQTLLELYQYSLYTRKQ